MMVGGSVSLGNMRLVISHLLFSVDTLIFFVM